MSRAQIKQLNEVQKNSIAQAIAEMLFNHWQDRRKNNTTSDSKDTKAVASHSSFLEDS